MSRKSLYLVGTATAAFFVGGGALASDVTTYTYDALGRLVAVSTSGGSNNDLRVGTCYDRAGNRSTYTANKAGSPPPPCPPLPPAPPPAPGSAGLVAADRAHV